MQHGHLLTSITLIAILFASLACGDQQREPILVFAAASLTDPVTELGRRFEDETGVRADLNFGGSNALARQIVAGAPADLFLSAGGAPVDLLISEGVADRANVRELLGNELVVFAESVSEQIDTLEALFGDPFERVVVVDPGLGPAGRYAQEALRSAGVWDALGPKIVLASDVRAALSYVESGNADAGIVYRTDVATMPELSVVYRVPPEMHSPIRYLGVVPNGSDQSVAADELLRFLTSDDASDEFGKFGFLAAPSEAGQSR